MTPQSLHPRCLVSGGTRVHPGGVNTGTYSHLWRRSGMGAVPCPQIAPCDETVRMVEGKGREERRREGWTDKSEDQ